MNTAFLRLSGSLLALLLAAGCRTLPDLAERIPSAYIPTRSAPHLEHALQLPPPPSAEADAHVRLLGNARDAFTARSRLIDHAAVSLDVQYYIWRNDVSGSLLMRKLWQAAERGVRVRVLLDDNNTRGEDAVWAALNGHRNIEVRLFNPFLYRKWRFLGYIGDFPRLNRRMHNKSLVADNRAAIVGGRNIGDEYFGNHADTVFADMDVLVSGGVVTRLSEDFDRYWQSDSAYDLHTVVRSRPVAANRFTEPMTAAQQAYWQGAEQAPLARALRQKKLHYLTAQTQLVSDDPAKALNRHAVPSIGEHLDQALKNPKKELYLVSPYFVPTPTGVAVLENFARNGVDVTVFTNSLRATDVAAVHSGYARYRKPLLQAGVKLYEFKPDHAVSKNRDKGLTGSPAHSLHAKTFIVDKKRIFIGSLNLDPRSAHLNTEMGLVIRHPRLAEAMQQRLQRAGSDAAYRVGLDGQGKMYWYDPATARAEHREPEAGFWKRWLSRILSVLPIERLL